MGDVGLRQDDQAVAGAPQQGVGGVDVGFSKCAGQSAADGVVGLHVAAGKSSGGTPMVHGPQQGALTEPCVGRPLQRQLVSDPMFAAVDYNTKTVDSWVKTRGG